MQTQYGYENRNVFGLPQIIDGGISAETHKNYILFLKIDNCIYFGIAWHKPKTVDKYKEKLGSRKVCSSTGTSR
jgi:hypothetical protein